MSEAAPKKSSPVVSWTTLARKVGQSEDDRARAIKDLRRIQDLSQRLRDALQTRERPLALEVISALGLKGLVPELLQKVPDDQEGFLTIAVNSMMDSQNQKLILTQYTELLTPKKLKTISKATAVAMLEPLGRMNQKLPRSTLAALSQDASPDVRAGLLYYLRMLSLRHNGDQNLDLVTAMTDADEFQLRLQAISISSEILAHDPTKSAVAALKTPNELAETCSRELDSQVRLACSSFLAPLQVRVTAKK